MNTAAVPSKKSIKTILFLVLKIFLALSFLATAVPKLIGLQQMVADFDAIGFGQWFRYFTAACEILGAILLLVPRTVTLGAVLLGSVCVGAFFAQLLVLHEDIIHTIVLAAILFAIAWASRPDWMRG